MLIIGLGLGLAWQYWPQPRDKSGPETRQITEPTPPTPEPPPVQPQERPNTRRYRDVPYVADIRSVPLPQSLPGWQRYATLSGGILLLFLGYLGYLYFNRRIRRPDPPDWDREGPWRFSLAGVGGEPAPILDRDTLGEAADAVSYFESARPARTLDVPATLRATLAAGGLPVLRFHKARRIRTVLILRDAHAEGGFDAGWNRAAQELAAGIERHGVPVIQGIFRGAPERFRTTDGNVQYLEDLEDERGAFIVLIFSDARRIEPSHIWRDLRQWPQCAWLDYREPALWRADHPAHRYGLPLYSADGPGIRAALGRFLSERGADSPYVSIPCATDARKYQTGEPTAAGLDLSLAPSLALSLAFSLGDALAWAEACAVLQPVSLGLADGLRRRFHPHLPATRLSRLLALPGTHRTMEGIVFSPAVRRVLKQGFVTRRSPEEQRAVLGFLIDAIDEACPVETPLGVEFRPSASRVEFRASRSFHPTPMGFRSSASRVEFRASRSFHPTPVEFRSSAFHPTPVGWNEAEGRNSTREEATREAEAPNSTPDAPSLAYLDWQSRRALLRLELGEAVPELAGLAQTPLKSALTARLAGFGGAGEADKIPLATPPHPDARPLLAGLPENPLDQPTQQPVRRFQPLHPWQRLLAGSLATLLLVAVGLTAWEANQPQPAPPPNWRVTGTDALALLRPSSRQEMPGPSARDGNNKRGQVSELADSIRLEPDTGYTLRLYGGGYWQDEELRVAEGQQLQLTLARKAFEPPSYTLTIQPTPTDAEVRFQDGERVYRPGMRLAAGRYEMAVSKSGFEDWREELVLEKDTVLAVALRAIPETEPVAVAPSAQSMDYAKWGPLWKIQGHAESVWPWGQPRAQFSPDGRTLLSTNATRDGLFKLWDVRTGEAIRTFEGHSDRVRSVAFSPDGRSILSGSDDNTLKLWDAASGRAIRSFQGHSGAVFSVAFSPDGRSVLSGSRDKTLKLWDAASGREIRTFQGHSGWVTSVAFSPDGRSVLSGSYDNTLKRWDAASGRAIRTFRGHSDWVRSVAFSPDGQSILSGSDDNTLKLWDVASGPKKEDQSIRTLKGHSSAVMSVVFAPDGRSILSGSWDNTLKLWDVASGPKKEDQSIRTLKGHSTYVRSVTFSPDGRRAASGDAGGVLILWGEE